MITSIQFVTQRRTDTQYQIVDAWDSAFKQWCESNMTERGWSQIVVFTDEQVWAIYEDSMRAALAPLNLPVVTLMLPAGETSKDFSMLPGLVDTLIQNRVHRRDLLICFGGGVCCDLGGLLALLYMRGLDYVNLPTSLMAQIDAAIGGKVGANFGLRKNLLGGFHHPLLVLVDPTFLSTLPDAHISSALAEAVKIAIIRQDERLLELLEEQSRALLNCERKALLELLERCIRGKLDLLVDDPYECDLNRALNLGHGVAHALERLPVLPGERQPLHGEAVALGLAATIRYAFRCGLCSPKWASRLLRVLLGLGLPILPGSVNTDRIKEQLSRIVEHRGGLFRFVIPTDKCGVRILPAVDLDTLVECLFPISGLPL
jgi:3-dehydroquinate synthase